MPFFYSQYLKDEKKKGGNGAAPKQSNGRPGRRPPGKTPMSMSGRLVWHSGTGATGKAPKEGQSNFKPLKYDSGRKKKALTVHFSTIEVQPFRFDWSLAGDVFYSRKELTAMGQSRFDDAATLRQQRHLDEKTADDVGLSQRSKGADISTLLTLALEDEDRDDRVSIRGIEHFVYPGLQQEMIRRKKEVQREVMEFLRNKRPDPQGWRLAQHSRKFSQWARNVALEKGMKQCMNNAANDPDVELSEDDYQRFQASSDELEASSRTLKGSSSFSASRSFTGGSPASFDLGITQSMSLEGIEEDDKVGDGKTDDRDEIYESQPHGADTGES